MSDLYPTDDFNLLDILCHAYGTDKGTKTKVRTPKGYTREYAHHFGPIRDKVTTVLELGILDGASLMVWERFFPNATIHGIDIKPCALRTGNVTCHRGSITDRGFLRHFAATSGPFDIVIDDASHRADDSRIAFEELWSHVREGGYYAVEDMHADPEGYRHMLTNLWADYGVSYLPCTTGQHPFVSSLAIFHK